jgi:two-component system response regulator ResD
MMRIKVLVTDDDPIFRDLVCSIVKKEGYSTLEACDGRQAIQIFSRVKDIDLLILDVMMPNMDGWAVLKEIRESSNVPVIMLTALGDELSEVCGLKKGADDYIAKPFSYEVFVARLNAHLRKVKLERSALIEMGEILIRQSTHQVFVSGNEVELNHKEYELLQYFAKNKNRVLSREQILSHVWSYDFDGDIRTIDTHVKTLRAKLGSCGEIITTIRGTGYMLEWGEP